ncbi:hypothetical protein D3C74_268750 [compost metagenome]
MIFFEASFYNRQIDFLFQLWKRHIICNIAGNRFPSDFPLGLQKVNRLTQCRIKILSINRLKQIVNDLGVDRLSCKFEIIVPTDDNRQQLRIFLLYNLQEFDPVHFGHLHIYNDQIRAMKLHHLKSGFSIRSLQHLTDLQSFPIPQYGNRLTQRLFIVNYQYLIHGCRLPEVLSSSLSFPCHRFESPARQHLRTTASIGYSGSSGRCSRLPAPPTAV